MILKPVNRILLLADLQENSPEFFAVSLNHERNPVLTITNRAFAMNVIRSIVDMELDACGRYYTVVESTGDSPVNTGERL